MDGQRRAGRGARRSGVREGMASGTVLARGGVASHGYVVAALDHPGSAL